MRTERSLASERGWITRRRNMGFPPLPPEVKYARYPGAQGNAWAICWLPRRYPGARFAVDRGTIRWTRRETIQAFNAARCDYFYARARGEVMAVRGRFTFEAKIIDKPRPRHPKRK